MDNHEIEGHLFNEIDDELDTYLAELNSSHAPKNIKKSWIEERLDINEKDFSTLRGYRAIHLGRGHTSFDHQQAEFIGYIWYFHKRGQPLIKAVTKAENFLKGDLSLKPL